MTDAASVAASSSPAKAEVVETLLQVVPGAVAVAVVLGTPDRPAPGLAPQSWAVPGYEEVLTQIEQRVRAQLVSGTELTSFSCKLGGIGYGVLLEPVRSGATHIAGALFVARQGRAWADHERSITRAFGALLGELVTVASHESSLLRQRSLDELVARVASLLMGVSATTRKQALDATVKALGEYLEADVTFLRRNDHGRGVTILEAEWPVRVVTQDPDPLGEVSFDADPIFGALRDLRHALIPAGPDMPDDYLRRVEEASGIFGVVGAAVPLLHAEITWGVLGVLHFSQVHNWTVAEVNALQAIATLLVQVEIRIEAEQRMEYVALHDELTHLPNRRALIQAVDRRLRSRGSATILFIDLDRFKVMNDLLGHASGDVVLETIAARIRTSIRPEDLAARLGGDEFVIMLDASSSEIEAVATAERLLDQISKPIEVAGEEVTHTASIGIARCDAPASTMDALRWADVALHGAKGGGGNRILVLDDSLRTGVDERSQTELSLRRAIDHDGLRLHYQPEVDLRTGEIVALEALVRWEHPTRGLLPASQFITVAEQTALIVDLGRWVMTEACRQIGEWVRERPDSHIVTRVNISPVQFLTHGLVGFVDECLRANGIAGNRLCVEITEHSMLRDGPNAARVLRGLQRLGITIALDDFGTGFASMTELKRLPVNVLKLDQQFVQGIVNNRSDRAIVDAIIRLGRALDLDIIAEGVEVMATVDALLELGCTRGQGFLFSGPLPADELTEVLARGRVPIELSRN